MAAGMVFFKKELTELRKTAKAIVAPATFLVFGLTGPIVAKLLPELLPKLLKDVPELAGFTMRTTALDAWLQYVKSANQMGMLAIVLLFMGLVAEERSKGTALIILTKPLSRTSFILAKFAASAVLLLASIWLGYLACLYYTDVLFPSTAAGPGAAATALYSAYALLVLAITLFASTISRNSGVSAGVSLGGLALVSLTAYEGLGISRWSPGALAALENSIIAGKAGWAEAWLPLASTMAVVVALVAASALTLNRKEL